MYKFPKAKRSLVFILVVFCVSVSAISSYSQSTDMLSPTPIVSNTLRGKIPARDVGDSRLTTFYYSFIGNRGDIFVNVLTKNLNGDIEVFTSKGLKSRTKITLYADAEDSETGRVVYMRQKEPLILRVQGRTPNDDPATFEIKFAGSFSPISASEVAKRDELPEIDVSRQGTVRVNSVGTIIEEENVPTAKPKVDGEISKEVDVPEKVKDKTSRSSIPSTFDPRKESEKIAKPRNVSEEAIIPKRVVGRPRLVITDPYPKKKDDDEKADLTVEMKEKPPRSALVTIERVAEEEKSAATDAEKKAKALAKIRLVIILKNGEKFTRQMSKVGSVNVFDGVLKVVGIDGSVNRFSILDVAKMTIE